MRDPYTPPEAPPRDLPEEDNVKRPASVTSAMVLCAVWIIAIHPAFNLAKRTGRFDWLMAIIVAVVLFTIVVSLVAPRSRLRQRALAAVYTISLLRIAQTILAVAKHDPAGITLIRAIAWTLFITLFSLGLLRVLAGPAAMRFFNSGR